MDTNKIQMEILKKMYNKSIRNEKKLNLSILTFTKKFNFQLYTISAIIFCYHFLFIFLGNKFYILFAFISILFKFDLFDFNSSQIILKMLLCFKLPEFSFIVQAE